MGVTGLVSRAVVHRSQAREDLGRLAAVFDECAPAFFRYAAVRVGDSHLAEDLVQQLWVQASTNARTVPAAEIEYWLRGILTNLVRTHWRKSRRRPHTLSEPALAAELAARIAREDLPDALLERQEVRDQLLLAVTELPSAQQDLIVEHYFHDKPHAEMARRHRTTERAIEGRLYRARQLLKQALGRSVPDSDG